MTHRAETATEEFFERSGGDWAINKDPEAVLDYTLDWSAWLADSGNDSIAQSGWTSDAGIIVLTFTNTATETVVWITGGQRNIAYLVTNQIDTVNGRTQQQSFYVVGKDR